MSALKQALLSASQQFMFVAQPAILNVRARSLVAAAAMALATAAAVMPAPASAQNVFWGQGGAQNNNSGVLPENSAGRWGEMLGSAVGRAAGAMLGGNNASSDIGRRAQEVITGVTEEVGRNVGRGVATQPYANQQGTSSNQAMPVYEQDFLDTAGLRAIFANGEASRLPRNTAAGRDAADRYDQAQREFELALRASSDRGFSINQWIAARSVLQQPLRSVPEERLAAIAQAMSSRLYRPGGPGFQAVQNNRSSSLESLRVSMQGRQVYSAPSP